MTGDQPNAVRPETPQERLAGKPVSAALLSTEEWLRQFDAWVRDHSSRNPHLDDSRENIYPDRG